LRRIKQDLDAAGAVLFCVVPMDRIRCRTFRDKKTGDFRVLSDPAGRVSSIYGCHKQQIVHNEWVNVPATYVIDTKGTITYAYVGKSWSDRPMAATLLDAVRAARGR
jgi:peroxiredoxin